MYMNRSGRVMLATEIDGDAHFPEIDESLWTEVSREEVPAGEKDDHATRYVVYQRRQTAH